MKQIAGLFAFCSLVIGSQSCNESPIKEYPAATNTEMSTVKAEIEAANKKFMDMFAAGDSVGIASSYTTDARFMSEGAPAVEGRANIQTDMSNIFKAGITGVDIRLENVYGVGDLIAEEGELTIYAGKEAVSEEKYIVLWKKEDGTWKMFRDIYNSNWPAK